MITDNITELMSFLLTLSTYVVHLSYDTIKL